MLYFAQDVGEDGSENMGFGDPSRTSIFDYAGVPSHQRWMNKGKFDGGLLSEEEKSLREFYKRLMKVATENVAISGYYQQIHLANQKSTLNYDERLFSFVRWHGNNKLVVVSNFDDTKEYQLDLLVPKQQTEAMQLTDGTYSLKDLMYGGDYAMQVVDGIGTVNISLAPLQSLVLAIN